MARSRVILVALLVAASGSCWFAPTAVADVLILRCEFQHYVCSPEIYTIDLEKHTGTWSCAGRPAEHMGYLGMQISREAIVVPGRSDIFFSVNRLTGDAIALGRFRGRCQKVESKQF